MVAEAVAAQPPQQPFQPSQQPFQPPQLLLQLAPQPAEEVPQPVEVPQQSSTLLHLQSIDKIKSIPMVEAALALSTDFYQKVKGYNPIFNWTLATAESTIHKALPLASPILKTLETPINIVDNTFCKGLTIVEENLPIVKQSPQQIYETAQSYILPILDRISAVEEYASQKAKSLKELSWNKANEVLATRCGNIAYTSFNTAAAMAEAYFDKAFPPTEAEQREQSSVLSVGEPDNDRVLHIVHTVRRLSTKFGRRIYQALSNRVKNLNKKSVQEYITSLFPAMQLTNYLNTSSKTKPVPTSLPESTPGTSTQEFRPLSPIFVSIPDPST